MHGLIADSAGGAWTFGGSILSFAFPMILFIVVAGALYVLYTKPEFVPGHRAPGLERPVSYTAVPGKPPADARPSRAAPGQARRGRAPVAPPSSRRDGRGRRETTSDHGGWDRGRGVTSAAALPQLDQRGTPPVAAVGRGHDSPRAGRADQAAHHRTAPGHHRPGHAAGPARPALAAARPGHAGRRHARRGQRQHDQLLHRPRHRRGDEAHLAPPPGRQRAGHDQALGGAGLGDRPGGRRHAAAGPDGQLAGGLAGRRGHLVLHLRLHAAAQAAQPVQHRDRRRRGLLPGAGRLGRGHRHGRPGPPWCCSRSSSCGPRRTSGRWP